MDGMWAATLYDENTKQFYAGRDHIGIVPLYYGTTPEGTIFLASELKTIHDQVNNVAQFPPGKIRSHSRPLHFEHLGD